MHFVLRILSVILAAIVAGSIDVEAQPGDQFQAVVNPQLKPIVTTLKRKGVAEPIAASRRLPDRQTNFAEGIVVIRPQSDAALRSFLTRTGGRIVADNTAIEPPPQLHRTLSEAQKRPTQFVVRVDLSRVDVARLPDAARALNMHGKMEFSSQGGLATFALVIESMAAGEHVSRDIVLQPQQFPQVLSTTRERAKINALPIAPPGGGCPPPPTDVSPAEFWDALSRFTAGGAPNDPFVLGAPSDPFGATGSKSNVTAAWQFVAAHGVELNPDRSEPRRHIVILDAGFWLGADGRPLGTDTDLPVIPVQHDYVNDDAIADGINNTPCSQNNICFWHGTGSASVAAGGFNNGHGFAGTGSLVADPWLFTAEYGSELDAALLDAAKMGADVFSISSGGFCDAPDCDADLNQAFVDAFAEGERTGVKTVFIASAGNGVPLSYDINVFVRPFVGADVGAARSDNFFSPCTLDHVICVGALNDDANTAQPWSNFGANVDIWAPTNIQVMARPIGNDIGFCPAVPSTFGGTSASAPFVAGVVALMKAINHNINSDQAVQILQQSQTGIAPVTHMVDAFAAVKIAAKGIPIVRDRHEPNETPQTATDLGAQTSYREADLNLEAGDQDVFRFNVPIPSLATIKLESPSVLSPVSVASLSRDGACPAETTLSDVSTPGPTGNLTQHVITAHLLPGPHVLALASSGIGPDSVTAYNLNIDFNPLAIAEDAFEINDTLASATHLMHPTAVFGWPVPHVAFAYDADIDATTIHKPRHPTPDVDHYIVRGVPQAFGAANNLVFRYEPALRLYDNDAPIYLDVDERKDDGTIGAPVISVVVQPCAPVTVPLQTGKYYHVQVAGVPGAYKLSNDAQLSGVTHIPILVHDRVYFVLHPGITIERAARPVEYFVVSGDPAFNTLQAGARVHLRLFDERGARVAEGVRAEGGEALDIARLARDQVYALEVSRTDREAQAPKLSLSWRGSAPRKLSANLLQNGGAEQVDAHGVPTSWAAISGTPHAIAYEAMQDVRVTLQNQATNSGHFAFAGDAAGPMVAHQTIAFDRDWLAAIASGNARAELTGNLGGQRGGGAAGVQLTFLDRGGRAIGGTELQSISQLEREGKAMLLPQATAIYVPAGAVAVDVKVTLGPSGAAGDRALADDISLVLEQFGG